VKINSGDTVIIATHNQGKLKEITQALAGYGLKVDSAGNLGLEAPDETADTFEGNALLKARYLTTHLGQIAIADDSGLVVPALDGLPGIHSARWGGIESDFAKAGTKVQNLLEGKARDAYFVCVLAVVFPNNAQRTFEGRCYGSLTWPMRGTMGFGYDAMFIPEGETRTFGEMLPLEKAKISHRTKAFALLKQELLGA